MATITHVYNTKGGQLSITRFNGGRWRLWAGNQFLASFATAEEAVAALTDGKIKWPAGLDAKHWKAPNDLGMWRFGTRA